MSTRVGMSPVEGIVHKWRNQGYTMGTHLECVSFGQIKCSDESSDTQDGVLGLFNPLVYSKRKLTDQRRECEDYPILPVCTICCKASLKIIMAKKCCWWSLDYLVQFDHDEALTEYILYYQKKILGWIFRKMSRAPPQCHIVKVNPRLCQPVNTDWINLWSL